MAPIGLALVICGVILLNGHWGYGDKFPYAFSIITSNLAKETGRPFLEPMNGIQLATLYSLCWLASQI